MPTTAITVIYFGVHIYLRQSKHFSGNRIKKMRWAGHVERVGRRQVGVAL